MSRPFVEIGASKRTGISIVLCPASSPCRLRVSRPRCRQARLRTNIVFEGTEPSQHVEELVNVENLERLEGVFKKRLAELVSQGTAVAQLTIALQSSLRMTRSPSTIKPV
jgi:hypothetical protein